MNTEDIKPGDRVRSYDFPNDAILERDTGCYIEGVVETVGVYLDGCPRYRIRVTKRVWDEQEEPLPVEPDPIYVFPPVNGTPTLFGRVTDGVEKL